MYSNMWGYGDSKHNQLAELTDNEKQTLMYYIDKGDYKAVEVISRLLSVI